MALPSGVALDNAVFLQRVKDGDVLVRDSIDTLGQEMGAQVVGSAPAAMRRIWRLYSYFFFRRFGENGPEADGDNCEVSGIFSLKPPIPLG